MKFTPKDLQTYYPGKYDNWKFAQNSKGEWVGSNKKEQGVIGTATNKDGSAYPLLNTRTPESLAPAMGAIPEGILGSIKKLFRK